MILNFRNRMSGKIAFSKRELSLILGVYGAKVQKGVWHDYAIDSMKNMATFSIYKGRRGHAAFVVAKIPSRAVLSPAQFAVYKEGKELKYGASLQNVLKVFEDFE